MSKTTEAAGKAAEATFKRALNEALGGAATEGIEGLVKKKLDELRREKSASLPKAFKALEEFLAVVPGPARHAAFLFAFEIILQAAPASSRNTLRTWLHPVFHGIERALQSGNFDQAQKIVRSMAKADGEEDDTPEHKVVTKGGKVANHDLDPGQLRGFKTFFDLLKTAIDADAINLPSGPRVLQQNMYEVVGLRPETLNKLPSLSVEEETEWLRVIAEIRRLTRDLKRNPDNTDLFTERAELVTKIRDDLLPKYYYFELAIESDIESSGFLYLDSFRRFCASALDILDHTSAPEDRAWAVNQLGVWMGWLAHHGKEGLKGWALQVVVVPWIVASFVLMVLLVTMTEYFNGSPSIMPVLALGHMGSFLGTLFICFLYVTSHLQRSAQKITKYDGGGSHWTNIWIAKRLDVLPDHGGTVAFALVPIGVHSAFLAVLGMMCLIGTPWSGLVALTVLFAGCLAAFWSAVLLSWIDGTVGRALGAITSEQPGIFGDLVRSVFKIFLSDMPMRPSPDPVELHHEDIQTFTHLSTLVSVIVGGVFLLCTYVLLPRVEGWSARLIFIMISGGTAAVLLAAEMYRRGRNAYRKPKSLTDYWELVEHKKFGVNLTFWFVLITGALIIVCFVMANGGDVWWANSVLAVNTFLTTFWIMFLLIGLLMTLAGILRGLKATDRTTAGLAASLIVAGLFLGILGLAFKEELSVEAEYAQAALDELRIEPKPWWSWR